MAVYSELIKNFEKIREYVRDFYIFGFHTRESFDAKSKRTYDNEKRRIESWLSGHVHTSLEGHKKKVSVQVDSGNIFQNPLYQCYRSKTFTDNDIRLHFILMDALEDSTMSVSEIADYISENYGMVIDVQIIRIKLKEYVKEGLVSEVKCGRNILYTKTGCYADDIASQYKGLVDMIKFFSEENPFGVVGSFIMNKLNAKNNTFVRKHAYMVHTLDDEILIDIMGAMEQKKAVLLSCVSRKKDKKHEITAVPLKIHCSVQTGRNYLIMYFKKAKRLMSVRVDSIVKVTPLDVVADYDTYYRYYEDNRRFLWGTSFGKARKYGQKEHIHMEIAVDEAKEMYVVKRLEREKRSGTVTKISNGLYAFDIDLFDANEAFPWIKTFIGRIAAFETTNEDLQDKFDSDIARLYEIYGGADK